VDSIHKIQRFGKFDLLKLPIIGGFLRGRFGRFFPQLVLFLIAALVIFDGFTGPQLAPANNATVLSWVVFRGFGLFTLLIAGNLFCAACPFTLTRTIARKISISGKRWPKTLRNKWISIGTLFVMFWLYEWLDLWASPLLTAWIVVVYFTASMLLEALFSESPFCKYVCPLGAFNFVNSTISPLQIHARDVSVCVNCVGKECVNGSEKVLGCGTELYVPMLSSNMDCTLCLDCSRACPYDNVGLSNRKLFSELMTDSLRSKWDYSFLVIGLSLSAILNAFGMVSPIYTVLDWLEDSLGIAQESIRLMIIIGLGVFGLGALIAIGCGKLGEMITRENAKIIASRYATAFVPLGAGIWLAHYGFHLIVGGLSIIPVMQNFMLGHGINVLGTTPKWDVGSLLPMEFIFPFQIIVVLLGFFSSLYVLGKKSLVIEKNPNQAFLIILPWALILMLMTIVSLSIFNLPMEMRGAIGGV